MHQIASLGLGLFEDGHEPVLGQLCLCLFNIRGKNDSIFISHRRKKGEGLNLSIPAWLQVMLRARLTNPAGSDWKSRPCRRTSCSLPETWQERPDKGGFCLAAVSCKWNHIMLPLENTTKWKIYTNVNMNIWYIYIYIYTLIFVSRYLKSVLYLCI